MFYDSYDKEQIPPREILSKKKIHFPRKQPRALPHQQDTILETLICLKEEYVVPSYRGKVIIS